MSALGSSSVRASTRLFHDGGHTRQWLISGHAPGAAAICTLTRISTANTRSVSSVDTWRTCGRTLRGATTGHQRMSQGRGRSRTSLSAKRPHPRALQGMGWSSAPPLRRRRWGRGVRSRPATGRLKEKDGPDGPSFSFSLPVVAAPNSGGVRGMERLSLVVVAAWTPAEGVAVRQVGAGGRGVNRYRVRCA
jgi:hypothetical protein